MADSVSSRIHQSSFATTFPRDKVIDGARIDREMPGRIAQVAPSVVLPKRHISAKLSKPVCPEFATLARMLLKRLKPLHFIGLRRSLRHCHVQRNKRLAQELNGRASGSEHVANRSSAIIGHSGERSSLPNCCRPKEFGEPACSVFAVVLRPIDRYGTAPAKPVDGRTWQASETARREMTCRFGVGWKFVGEPS
jgi:hypothetical protein